MSDSRWTTRSLLVGLVPAAVTGYALFLLPRPEKAPGPPRTLPAEDREFLWDAEHHGLLLTRYGWNTLCSALVRVDRSGIEHCLADGFRCEWPTSWTQTEVATDEIHGSRARPNTDDAESLEAAEFVAWLFQLRERFDSSLTVRFKLTAMQPVDRNRVAGVWQGAGRLVLEGSAAGGGPLACRVDLVFRTPRPTEERLADGRWLFSSRVSRTEDVATMRFFLEDVSRTWGVDVERLHDNWTSDARPVNTGGVYLCDYNRDGCVDLLVTDSFDRDGLILYRGRPEGGFDDVTQAVGLPRVPRTIDAIFADLDNDGWEDIVLPGKYVLRNYRGERFEDVSGLSNLDDWIYDIGAEAGLDSLSGVSVADFNRDGLIDLYVTRADAHAYDLGSWVDGQSGDGFGNQLLRNLGNWQFADVTRQTGTDGGQRSVFTSVWLDANNDDWPDVYVIHEFGGGLLLLNEAGKTFRPAELTQRSSDFGSMGLTCGDIDNDGHIDLYVSNMYSSAGNRVMDNLSPGLYDDTIIRKLRHMVAGNQLYRNLGGVRFEAIADRCDVAQVGWGWGPALVDLNNDGWLDIYATCGFMSRLREKPDG